MQTFREWLSVRDPQILMEMNRRGFLGTLGAMAATGLASKAMGAVSGGDWKQLGYREITNMKDWQMQPSYGFDDHGQMAKRDDIINNIHILLKNNDIDQLAGVENSIANKKRNELVPGKDFRIFEVIPETFLMKYLIKDSEKFKRDLKSFKDARTKLGAGDDDDLKYPSKQSVEQFSKPKLVVFLPTRMSRKNSKGAKEGESREFSGLAHAFKPYVYDAETDSYKRNSKFNMRTLLGEKSVIMPVPEDLRKLNIEQLPEDIKSVLAHEIRHTTQEGGTGQRHVLARQRGGAMQGKDSYLGNSNEMGVRIAVLKEMVDAGRLNNLFENAVRQTVYSDILHMPMKMVWAQEVKKKFKTWQSSSEKMKAVDLISVQPCGHKLGYRIDQMSDADYKSGKKTKLDERQAFQNDVIATFITSFINQDRQLQELYKSVMHGENFMSGNMGIGVEEIKDELDRIDLGENPAATAYNNGMVKYVLDNWDYVVHDDKGGKTIV